MNDHQTSVKSTLNLCYLLIVQDLLVWPTKMVQTNTCCSEIIRVKFHHCKLICYNWARSCFTCRSFSKHILLHVRTFFAVTWPLYFCAFCFVLIWYMNGRGSKNKELPPCASILFLSKWVSYCNLVREFTFDINELTRICLKNFFPLLYTSKRILGSESEVNRT